MKLKWRCVIRATLMQLFFCPRRWWWKRFVCHFYALVYMGSISSIVPEVLNANWSSWPCLVRNGTRLAILWFAASSNSKSESCGFFKGRLQGYWAFVPQIRGFSGSCLQNGPISWGPTSSGIHFLMGQIGVSLWAMEASYPKTCFIAKPLATFYNYCRLCSCRLPPGGGKMRWDGCSSKESLYPSVTVYLPVWYQW